MTESKDDIVEQTIDKAKPLLMNIGFGSIMGYCSGMAVKKVSKVFGFIIGTTFIGLQIAVSLGYIDVKWDKVADGVHAKIDLTNDGVIDGKDVKEYWKKFKMVVTKNLPSAGGFSLGFLCGVKYG
jgi:uncharacterized membrane protein (Fun14 family)